MRFTESLLATGAYRTPEHVPIGLLDRLMGRFDWWYHLRVILVFVAAARAARFGRYDDARWTMDSERMMAAVEGAGGRFDVQGLQHIRGLSPRPVIIGNHMSTLETITLPAILLPFTSLCIVLKESLLRYPALGDVLSRVDPIAVTRADPRSDLRAVLEGGQKALEGGRAVVIFPQATRSPIFDRKQFNTLGVKLARRAKAPIVPLALKTDFHGNGKRIKEFGPVTRSHTIRFHFGEPFEAGSSPKMDHEKVVRHITGLLREWGGQIRQRDNEVQT
jgi:1-acyl-sn-glycerol-3-phosphate acyltransferase